MDVDITARGLRSKLLRRAASFLKQFGPPATTHGVDRERHDRIMEQVHFAGGARAEDVAAMLGQAGFENIVIDRRFGPIRRAQARHMPLKQRIDRASQDRYAIHASRPVQQDALPAEPGRRAA